MGFVGILRQSTAVDVLIGPFVGSDNGDDEETGLTIAQANVLLHKNGQAGAQKNDNTTCAHDADGYYNCELDATDTNTVGQLTLQVHVAGALAVRHDFQVIEEAVYDIMFAASATGAVPVASIANGAITAAAIATGAIDADAIADNAIDAGAIASDAITAAKIAADAITAAKIADGAIDAATFAAGAINAAAIANGAIDAATFAAGAIDATAIASNAITAAKIADDAITAAKLATGAFTADAFAADAITASAIAADALITAEEIADQVWEEALADHEGTAGSTAEALADAGGSGASAADIADAVWDEAQAGHVTAGSFGEIATEIASILVDTGTTLDGKIDTIDTNVDSILADTGTDGVVLANDAITAAKIAANAIGASELAADAITEIQSGLATAAALTTVEGKIDTIDNFLDTEVAAILADTNELQTDLTDGGRLDLLIDAIKAKTDGLPTDPADASDIAAAVAALNDLSAAEVNAEVVDALNVDTYGEPTGVPGATVSLAAKISRLYMALRNRVDVTSTKKTFYDDGNAAEWEQDLSDDGTTYSQSEANAI